MRLIRNMLVFAMPWIALAMPLGATQQVINVSTPNSGLGDPAFTAFSKVNTNFTELYGLVAPFALSQSANTILAAPNGSSGVPSFRALTTADLPPTVPVAGTFTASGCSNSTLVGGASSASLVGAGSFVVAVSGACVITLTFPTAMHGWACHASDMTSPAQFNQTAKSTSSCTIAATTVTGDLVTYIAVGY